MNRITTLALLAMTSIAVAAPPLQRLAADAPLAQEIGKRMNAAERSKRVMKKSAKGSVYLQHEIQATVSEAFADTLAGKGQKRGKVTVEKIAKLHPDILRVEARHLSSRAWLNGLEMPEAVRRADGTIPRIARNVTLILRPNADALDTLAKLRAVPEFERLALDVARAPLANPVDERFNQQWALPKIGVPDALDVPPRGPIKVAVIDTGADLNHPDFAGKIVFHDGYGGVLGVGGFDDGWAPPDTGTKFDHGTHVAGIIAAKHDTRGIAGVSNQVQLMIMNCATWGAPFKDEYLIFGAGDAIRDAVDRGARVINCSFSGVDLDIPVLNDGVTGAIDDAYDNYILVVVSAGNEQQDVSSFWGQSAVPFIVSATMQAAQTADPEVFDALYSNFGARVDIAAPGTAILSTVPSWSIENDPNLDPPGPVGPPPIVYSDGATYRRKNGTSMAAPQVSGAAATIMSMNPGLIYDRGTKQLLQRMAQDAGAPGKDNQYGWGLLRLRTDFLWPLRNADAFVTNHAYNLDVQNGHYENPYQNLPAAIAAVPNGGTLVLNGGYRSLGNYNYPAPAQPITKPCVLTALPDHPVTIGQP